MPPLPPHPQEPSPPAPDGPSRPSPASPSAIPEEKAPADPALSAVDARKVYPGRGDEETVALDGVTVHVERGETLALVGESGSGKTTLLRMFNRTVEPTSGEIRVDGKPVAGRDPVELRRHMGYVQQEGGLIPHWRVQRNVELVPRLLGWEKERRRERAREMLELVGLPPDEVADRYPRQLSGGQRQRVAFARALAAEPEVVLMDEPFGALDALTRVELQEEFLRLKREMGRTMLLVTHHLGEAFKLADRIAVLLRGRVLQVAPPAELARSPAHPYVESLLELREG